MEAALAAGVEAAAVTRHAEPGDVPGAVAAIVAHYEAMGDEVMRWLALAERLPFVRQVTERGTESHLDWVEEVFAPDLEGLPRGRAPGPPRRPRDRYRRLRLAPAAPPRRARAGGDARARCWPWSRRHAASGERARRAVPPDRTRPRGVGRSRGRAR